MYLQPYIYHRIAGKVPFKHTYITPCQAARLIEKISSVPMPKDSCFGRITCALDAGAYVSRGASPNANYDFRIVPGFDMPMTFKCLCEQDRTTACAMSETEKLNTCTTCLSGGLCNDWYVRNTIGRILFPLFYEKTK